MKKNIIALIIVIILGYLCYCLLGWQSMLSGVLLTVISILLALAYEDFGDPSIYVEIPNADRIGESIYLRLKINNNPPNYWPFITRKTAESCHGTLSFYNSKFERYLLEEAKWTGNPEPIRLSEQRGIVLEPSLLRMARFIDIPADETEELDICFRDSTKRDAFLWNSESYIPNATHANNRQIERENSFLVVIIKHNYGNKKFVFRICNPENINEFKIVKIDPKDLKGINKHII